MLLSAVPVLVVAQWSSEIPEGLMNNPVLYNAIVYTYMSLNILYRLYNKAKFSVTITLQVILVSVNLRYYGIEFLNTR